MMEKNASFSLPCALELNKKTSKTKNATVACKQQDNLPLSSQRVPWPVIWFQSSGVITMVGCRFNWSKNIKMLTENERFRLLSSKGYKSAIQICSMNRKRKIRWLDECGMRCRVMLCEWFMSGTEVMFNSFKGSHFTILPCACRHRPHENWHYCCGRRRESVCVNMPRSILWNVRVRKQATSSKLSHGAPWRWSLSWDVGRPAQAMPLSTSTWENRHITINIFSMLEYSSCLSTPSCFCRGYYFSHNV